MKFLSGVESIVQNDYPPSVIYTLRGKLESIGPNCLREPLYSAPDDVDRSGPAQGPLAYNLDES